MGRNTGADLAREQAETQRAEERQQPEHQSRRADPPPSSSRPLESAEIAVRRRAAFARHLQERLVTLRLGMFDAGEHFRMAHGGWTRLARLLGTTDVTARRLVLNGDEPSGARIPAIADALQVDPRTILYWMGAYSLERLAASAGIAPWRLYARIEDYHADIESLEHYPELTYREVQRERYDLWWQASALQRAALRGLSDEEWARFVTHVNSERGREQVRADLAGHDPLEPDDRAEDLPTAATYLPAEFTGASQHMPVDAPPPPRARRHAPRPLTTADVEGDTEERADGSADESRR